jgi:hypothetical protein
VAWKPVDDAYLDSLYARELDKDIKAWPFVWIENLHSATRRPFLS